MWIFTTSGFISVVQSKVEENHLIVRARRMGDLKNLFPNFRPFFTPDADYPWRITIPRMQFIAVLLDQVSKLTYHNFKAEQIKGDYHDFLVQVWSRGLDYEDREPRISDLDPQRSRRWAPRFPKRPEGTGAE